MAKKLIIVLSGKKQSGKSSAAKVIFKEIANKQLNTNRFAINRQGNLIDSLNNNEIVPIDIPIYSKHLYDLFGIKLYSFADPLKEFLHNTMNLDLSLMYGSDSDKNTKTHISWESMSPSIRVKYGKNKKNTKEFTPASGAMTIREVLQVFGTDVCREMDNSCWARATYNAIDKSDCPISIVCDARFPNEISMGTERGAKVVRFLRKIEDSSTHIAESALDNFPLGNYSLVIDNSDLTLEEKNNIIIDNFREWMK